MLAIHSSDGWAKALRFLASSGHFLLGMSASSAQGNLASHCVQPWDATAHVHRVLEYRALRGCTTCVVANILNCVLKTLLDPKHFDVLRKFKAGIFKVLAHPTRIQVIETLRAGELSVGAILEYVKLEPANLSQHLSVLRHSHLVVTRK